MRSGGARRTRRLVALLASAALVISALVPPAAVSATATPIMGRHVLVADQLAAWYASTGRVPRLHGISVAGLARLFVEEGAKEGVRGDVAFAQAVFETGYFSFSDTVPPETNNFAGIGAPNDVARFETPRLGVRAQIQHLRAYGDPHVGTTGTSQPLVDPRFDRVQPKGVAPTFEELSGRWSAGERYGQKVVAIFERIRAHAGPSLRGSELGAGIRGGASDGRGGLWLLDEQGGVFSLGGARFHGSIPALRQSGVAVGRTDVVDLQGTSTGDGYRVLDAAGGVFAFGDARFHGSVPGTRAGSRGGGAPAVGVARTPSGDGYWVLDAAGGVFAFGDARFFGSVPGLRAAGSPVGSASAVDLAPTPSGDGYWVLDAAGGVFAFGDARFLGSIPALRAAGHRIGPARAVGLAPSVTGDGYWILDSAGGIFALGRAPFLGSLADDVVGVPFVDLDSVAGGGYRVVTADGGAFTYAR